MLIVMNKGLSIEDVLLEELKKYFSAARFNELYPVLGQVHIGLEHPFAALMDQNSRRDMRSLFPSITIVSASDEKVPEFAALNNASLVSITKDDIADIEKGGYQISSGAIAWIQEYLASANVLYGIESVGQLRDHVSIEIWAENIQAKNEIYSMIELFLHGPMGKAMQSTYEITIFGDTIRGQRSGNYNFDFGQNLYGGQISFDADYLIEQTVFDSELIELNKTVWAEVVNG
jgi:hypothetical protein